MDYYLISINGHLTSFVFYDYILKKLHEYYSKNIESPICFDFSKTKSIEPLVIPNLLCVGHIIKENSHYVPRIYIPNNYKSKYIKTYLNEINFFQLAEKYNLFEIDISARGGIEKSRMNKLNTTIFFSNKENEQVSWNKLIQFAKKYLTDFIVIDEKFNTYNNLVINSCKEVIENAKIHGLSFAFLTLQYNYSHEKVYISIADCGQGFKTTINQQMNEDGLEFNIIDRKVKNELEGIIQGIFARFNSEYGLYSLIKSVLKKEGTVRIHSMDTQFVITRRLFFTLEVSKSVITINNMLKNDNFKKNNIRRNLKYGGVHIEIEIPLNKNTIKRGDF